MISEVHPAHHLARLSELVLELEPGEALVEGGPSCELLLPAGILRGECINLRVECINLRVECINLRVECVNLRGEVLDRGGHLVLLVGKLRALRRQVGALQLESKSIDFVLDDIDQVLVLLNRVAYVGSDRLDLGDGLLVNREATVDRGSLFASAAVGHLDFLPSSRARRNKRNSMEELRKFAARRDGVDAKVSAEADGATSAQSSTANAVNNTEASKVEDPSIQEPKPKRKHRYLPDRLYFRGTKFQRQVLGIERSVNKRIDDKIAEMTTVLDAQYLHIMRAANRKATQLRTENRGLARRVERVEKQNRILERKLDELLDDVSINSSEMLRERLRRTRARFAQQRHDDNDNDGTSGFIMD
ncbi:hypothetical protein KAF25_004890 [Fusarium avenaceum]|uniref:Uncharacterized protein n=1 Tax=Fusarium avenaceum TaxID=40199 RepID=A0A9P7HCW0_9HYPO|nr:hypothetical protein KAF25_004890 [Fusarium avenaceum]